MGRERSLDEWSKEELIVAIRTLSAVPGTAEIAVGEAAAVHELRVHQIELEMQNRELREAQQQLEESRSRYADLYDLAPIGYCTIDKQGVVREANIEAARLLGTHRAYLTGRPLSAVVTTDLRRFRDHLDECLTKRARATCQLALTRNGGTTLIVQLVSTPLTTLGAATAACLTTLTDVSELKRSEERLGMLSAVGDRLAASLDYRTTLPAVAELLVPLLADVAFIDVAAADGRVERFSRHGVDVVSDPALTPQAEVLRTRTPLCVAAAGRVTLQSALGTTQRREPSIAGVTSGSLMLVPLIARERALGVLTCMVGSSGRPRSPAELGLAQDVAARLTMAVEQAQLYHEAQEAIRAREDIVAVVSHDLANPLHGIRLNCEHLLAHPARDDRREGRKQLDAMARGITRMAQMIGQLSEMARIEAGHLTLMRADHPIDALLDDALDLVRPLAERKRLSLRAPSRLPAAVVFADGERIAQVLSNLLGNAIRFSPDGGAVTLEAVVRGDVVRVAVSDRGPGIAPAQLGHIFERYWRSDERRRNGSGLGLYIAKSIVEAHGGRIGVDSVLDEGTTVWFTLPLGAATAPVAHDDARSDA